MSGEAGIERLYVAVEEAAGLLGVACSRDAMWPVLTAFQDVFADGSVVFNIVTSGGHVADLSFDFSVPPAVGDPYTHALAHGLVDETDHPIRALFADIQERFPIQSYGVDHRISGGFNKAYVFFPLTDLQDPARLAAAVPSLPSGLAEHVRTLADHGLANKVSAIAIDYARRTWNLYFNGLSPEHVSREAALSLIREFGLPEPSEQLLSFIETSSALYPTFGWDSTKVERLSFSTRTTDPAALPARIEPKLGEFAANAPYTYDGDRVLVYAGALSASEEYYKLAAYHQLTAAAHDRIRSAG
nr:aromatic prenyltransferase [Streptomyces antibioticus]